MPVYVTLLLGLIYELNSTVDMYRENTAIEFDAVCSSRVSFGRSYKDSPANKRDYYITYNIVHLSRFLNYQEKITLFFLKISSTKGTLNFILLQQLYKLQMTVWGRRMLA